MTCIEQLNADEAADEELAQRELDIQDRMQQEARDRIELLRSTRSAARKAEQDPDGLDDDGDDDEVEVEYRH